MGISGISPLSLLLIFLIIIALFGTSKFKTLGSDVGRVIKQLRDALNDNEPKSS